MEPAVTTPERPRKRPGVWAQLRPLVLRLHFYAGVLVAPFVLVAAVSGLLYVWTPQLEQVLYDDLLQVPSAASASAERPLPLTEQVRIAEAEVPGAQVDSVRPATTPEDSTWVHVTLPSASSDSHSSTRTTVFVNPYEGKVLGVSETYGTSGALPVRTWIDLLHRQLHLGEFGRLYSELAASWVGVVALGGFALWVARGRGRTQSRARSGHVRRRTRDLLVPGAGTSPGRRRTMSLHAATGVWLLLGLLFLSATGLTWSKYAGANITDLREQMSWTTPTVSTEAPAASPGVDAGLDAVLASAREAGLDGRVSVEFPGDHVSPYVVTQLERSWPTQADSAAVTQDTAEVTEVVRFEDHSLMAKMSRWGVDAHMGLLFGVPNQILLTVVCGGLIWVIVLGYRMWWQRRPTRSEPWSLGRPYPRGSFLALSLPLKAAAALSCVAVGWAMPVLGVSLAGFLLIDALLSWYRFHRGEIPHNPSPQSTKQQARGLRKARI